MLSIIKVCRLVLLIIWLGISLHSFSQTSYVNQASIERSENRYHSWLLALKNREETAVARISTFLPDLTLNNISLSTETIASAANFTVSCNLKNIGTGIAGYSDIGYYLSNDTVLDKISGQDKNLGSFDVNQNLEPGQQIDNIQKQLTIPCAYTPGTYYLFLSADDAYSMEESNETNNNFFKRIIIVQGPPIPSTVAINSNRSSDTLCFPDSVTLTAVISPQCSGCTYSWSTGSTSQSIVVKTSGTYLVNAGNICGQVSHSRFILFRHPPSILPKANPDKICLGDSTLLYETLGTDADSIVWTGPGLNPTTGGQVKVKPPAAGNPEYTETAYTFDRKCSSTKNVTVQVVSNPSPSLQISYNGCVNPTVFRIASVTNPGNNPQFKWYRNDTLINSGDTAISLNNVPKGTRIYATVKISGTCIAVDTARSNSITIDCFTTGIREIPGISQFMILPNPSTGIFVVKMALTTPKKIALSIISRKGEEILAIRESFWSGQIEKIINLENQPSGVYYLQLRIGNNVYAYKLIVAR